MTHPDAVAGNDGGGIALRNCPSKKVIPDGQWGCSKCHDDRGGSPPVIATIINTNIVQNRKQQVPVVSPSPPSLSPTSAPTSPTSAPTDQFGLCGQFSEGFVESAWVNPNPDPVNQRGWPTTTMWARMIMKTMFSNVQHGDQKKKTGGNGAVAKNGASIYVKTGLVRIENSSVVQNTVCEWQCSEFVGGKCRKGAPGACEGGSIYVHEDSLSTGPNITLVNSYVGGSAGYGSAMSVVSDSPEPKSWTAPKQRRDKYNNLIQLRPKQDGINPDVALDPFVVPRYPALHIESTTFIPRQTLVTKTYSQRYARCNSSIKAETSGCSNFGNTESPVYDLQNPKPCGDGYTCYLKLTGAREWPDETTDTDWGYKRGAVLTALPLAPMVPDVTVYEVRCSGATYDRNMRIEDVHYTGPGAYLDSSIPRIPGLDPVLDLALKAKETFVKKF